MKFAHIADIHLSRYSQDKIEDESRLPERLHSIKSALYEVANYCIKNNIFTIIIGGDLLHGKSVIYAIAQELMIQYFKDWAHLITFIVIDGNHDLSGKGDDVVSALRPLETIENVVWVPFNETKYMEEEDMLLVPYSTQAPELVKDNRANILVSHFGLSEGILNSGLSIVSDISLKDLTGRYKLVLLGHYHKPQEIIREDISLYYVGSPIQLDWGEKNDEKRFLVVDTETLEVESVPLQSYKKHIEIEVNAGNIKEAIKLAEEARENGDHIKLIKRDDVDVSGFKDFTIVDKTEADVTDRGITSTMSQEDKFKRYLEIKGVPEDKIDDYMKEATEIIQNCEV